MEWLVVVGPSGCVLGCLSLVETWTGKKTSKNAVTPDEKEKRSGAESVCRSGGGPNRGERGPGLERRAGPRGHMIIGDCQGRHQTRPVRGNVDPEVVIG